MYSAAPSRDPSASRRRYLSRIERFVAWRSCNSAKPAGQTSGAVAQTESPTRPLAASMVQLLDGHMLGEVADEGARHGNQGGAQRRLRGEPALLAVEDQFQRRVLEQGRSRIAGQGDDRCAGSCGPACRVDDWPGQAADGDGDQAITLA